MSDITRAVGAKISVSVEWYKYLFLVLTFDPKREQKQLDDAGGVSFLTLIPTENILEQNQKIRHLSIKIREF